MERAFAKGAGHGPMTRRGRRLLSCRGACGLFALTLGAALCLPQARAQARPERFLAVPGGSLAQALRLYAEQSGRQILFDPALARGHMIPAMRLRAGPQALARLLRGTGLRARTMGGGVILIEPAPPRAAPRRNPPETAPPFGPVQDIEVTALKRPSRIGRTPGLIEVRQGREIDAQGAIGLEDIARSLPSLAVMGTRTGEQRIALRGVYGTGEPTVGVYYGETPVSGPSGTTFDPGGTTPDIDLVDIERIEVLHGPQGTLYGASSMGGTLRILFNQPDAAAWHGRVTAGVNIAEGGTPGHEATAIGNIPLVTDRLAARFVVYRRRSSPFIAKPALGLRSVGAARRNGERISLAWTPAPAMRLTGTWFSHRLSMDDSLTWQGDAKRFVNTDPVRTPYESRLKLASLTGEAGLSGGRTLTVTLSRYRWSMLRQADFSSVLAGQRSSPDGCRRYYDLPPGEEGCDTGQMKAYGSFVDSRLPAILYQPMQVDSTSGEARLSSGANGAVEWTAGLFFENRHDSAQSHVVRADPVSGYALVPLDLTGLRTLDVSLRQRALFGEANWHFRPRWTATVGLRGFRYRRGATGTVPFPNIITGTGTLEEGAYATRESGSSLKVELSYRPSGNGLAYLRAAQGFRPGGVNITPSLTDAQRSYRADRLWSYELGLKRRLGASSGLQAALFHIDWNDMIYYASSANGAFSYNTNVGQVRIDGAEMQGYYRLTDQLLLRGRATFTDARLADDGAGLTGGRKGDRLPDISPLAYSVGVSWFRRRPGGGTLLARLDAHGISGAASRFNAAQPYYERLPAHILFDAALSLGVGGWDIALTAKNLFDAVGATRQVSSARSSRDIYGSSPRRYMLRLARSF